MGFIIYPDSPRKDLITPITGQKFGRLLVIGYAGSKPQTGTMWHCICDCGEGRTLQSSKLLSGHTSSCGCFRRERLRASRLTHGHSAWRDGEQRVSPEYNAFQQAMGRCNNPKLDSYPTHGGRGVEFRFKNFEEFYAELGDRPSPKHSVDRYPNNKTGHYERGNVRWATKSQQARNTRRNHLITIDGVTRVLIEWVEFFGHKWPTVKSRLRQKWCDVCAVSIPPSGVRCPHRYSL